MIGFIDESGDAGFNFARRSSEYFIITMVLFETEEDAQETIDCIEMAKTSLQKPISEFHFTNIETATKKHFFEAIKRCKFRVFTFIVDKRKWHVAAPSIGSTKLREHFLLSAFSEAMKAARDLGVLQSANLKFDESGGNAFQKRFASTVLAAVNGNSYGEYISKLAPQNSKTSTLLQLTDMICGATARQYNPDRKQEDYLEKIKHRLLPVQYWP